MTRDERIGALVVVIVLVNVVCLTLTILFWAEQLR